MAGGKRKRFKSLPEAKSNNKQNVLDEFESGPDFPFELLEAIITRLTLRQNICVSLVCKKWLDAATLVRVVNKPPWLMFRPKSRDMFELYDPSNRKFYWVELPELRNSRICYAKDSWLLIYKPETKSVMFINPYTREKIELTSFDLNEQAVAFSAVPTSPDCVVFTIKDVSPIILAISTCYPGEDKWMSANYSNRMPFVSSMWNKIVICNGHFYCLSLKGWLGDYDSNNHKWTVYILPPPECPEKLLLKNWWKSNFMAEHNGEIYVVYTSSDLDPVIYKLDTSHREYREWVQIKTLEGMTFFASFLSSHIRIDLVSVMRNCIYFCRVRFHGKRCISYSLDDRRYYPRRENYDWEEDDLYKSIWIEASRDVSEL